MVWSSCGTHVAVILNTQLWHSIQNLQKFRKWGAWCFSQSTDNHSSLLISAYTCFRPKSVVTLLRNYSSLSPKTTSTAAIITSHGLKSRSSELHLAGWSVKSEWFIHICRHIRVYTYMYIPIIFWTTAHIYAHTCICNLRKHGQQLIKRWFQSLLKTYMYIHVCFGRNKLADWKVWTKLKDWSCNLQNSK